MIRTIELSAEEFKNVEMEDHITIDGNSMEVIAKKEVSGRFYMILKNKIKSLDI